MSGYVIELADRSRRTVRAKAIEVTAIGGLIAKEGWDDHLVAAWAQGEWLSFWEAPNEESIENLQRQLRAFDAVKASGPITNDIAFTRTMIEYSIAEMTSRRAEYIDQLIESGRAEVKR